MNQYDLTVTSQAYYLPEQSNPEQHEFAFAYKIIIYNSGQMAAQLISRHWFVTSSDSQMTEVQGLGVVGQQPLLKPGETFEYTSWTMLSTSDGTMHGSYFCVAEDGSRFDAQIPEFILSMPRVLH